jgi:lipopolysaccharide assembly outer membrane protein LptD (OstA)
MLRASGGVVLQKDGGTLKAPSVQSDASMSRATASGGVTLQKDGAALKAREIRAFDKLSRASALGGAVLSRADGTLRAARMDARDKFQSATASGDVVLTRGDATLRAQRVEARDKFSTATASGGVRVSRADIAVAAQQATAFNIGSERTLRVEASGNVRATSAKGSVSAGRATWTGGREGQISAQSGVTISRDGNDLKASRGVAQLRDGAISSAQLTGGVRGQLSNGAIVSADSATYEVAGGGHFRARGGVTATRDGATLRSATLDATQGGDIWRLDGGITVQTRDGVTIRAPQARYDRVSDTLIASGGVTFTDTRRGVTQSARSMTVTNLRDKVRRRATLEGVRGSGKSNALDGLKLF